MNRVKLIELIKAIDSRPKERVSGKDPVTGDVVSAEAVPVAIRELEGALKSGLHSYLSDAVAPNGVMTNEGQFYVEMDRQLGKGVVIPVENHKGNPFSIAHNVVMHWEGQDEAVYVNPAKLKELAVGLNKEGGKER